MFQGETAPSWSRIGLGSVCKQQFKVSAYHCQLKHAMKVNGRFLESCTNTSRFFHPSNALFDDGALSIGRSVKLNPTVIVSRFVALVRNDRPDAASSKPIPNALNAVPFVSAADFFGRVRGRPRRCGMTMPFITDSSCVDSWTWPAVTSTVRGVPRPPVTRWNFDPNPPRLRPKAWSAGSSGRRSRLFYQRRHERRLRQCTKDPSR